MTTKEFLPTTMKDWVYIIVIAVGLVGAYYKLTNKTESHDRLFIAHASDIDENETEIKENSDRLNAIEKQNVLTTNTLESQADDINDLKSDVKTLKNDVITIKNSQLRQELKSEQNLRKLDNIEKLLLEKLSGD